MSVESRASVIVVDGTVVLAFPVAYAPSVGSALVRVVADARELGAPVGGTRPLADMADALDRVAGNAARSAATRDRASSCGHRDGNVLDANGPLPHRALHDVSVAELAKRTSLGARQLRRRAAAGRLPGARKVGDRWVVDLDEYERAQRHEDAASPR